MPPAEAARLVVGQRVVRGAALLTVPARRATPGRSPAQSSQGAQLAWVERFGMLPQVFAPIVGISRALDRRCTIVAADADRGPGIDVRDTGDASCGRFPPRHEGLRNGSRRRPTSFKLSRGCATMSTGSRAGPTKRETPDGRPCCGRPQSSRQLGMLCRSRSGLTPRVPNSPAGSWEARTRRSRSGQPVDVAVADGQGNPVVNPQKAGPAAALPVRPRAHRAQTDVSPAATSVGSAFGKRTDEIRLGIGGDRH
jgi:hypothetical protein